MPDNIRGRETIDVRFYAEMLAFMPCRQRFHNWHRSQKSSDKIWPNSKKVSMYANRYNSVNTAVMKCWWVGLVSWVASIGWIDSFSRNHSTTNESLSYVNRLCWVANSMRNRSGHHFPWCMRIIQQNIWAPRMDCVPFCMCSWSRPGSAESQMMQRFRTNFSQTLKRPSMHLSVSVILLRWVERGYVF